MDWASERYVRLYTRDTGDWLLLPWQARALLPLLLRKCDRLGCLPLGKRGVAMLGVLVGLPDEVARPGLDGLLADGCVTLVGDVVSVPNFVTAQTVRSSDVLRKEQSRDAARSRKEPVEVTPVTAVTNVTSGHQLSPAVTNVTDGHSSGAVPAVPAVPAEQHDTAGAPAPATPTAGTKGKRPKVKRERVLSATSVAVGEFIDATAQVKYPPASFDVLERVLRDDGLTHDDALLVVQQAARDPWCLGTIRLDPTVLFRRERWPGLLAHAKAGAPPKVPAKHRAEALDLYVPPLAPEVSQGDVDARLLRTAKDSTQALEVQQLDRWPNTGDVTEAECTTCHQRSRAIWVVTDCDDVIAALPSSASCQTHASRSAWDAIANACEHGLIANLRGCLDAMQPNQATLALIREIVDGSGWKADMLRSVLPQAAQLRVVGGVT
jgi:hypothetical protein